MGKRGPQRTPTAMLKLVGSTAAVYRERKEPKPPTQKPKPQIKLTRAEKRIFDSVCDMLRSMKMQAITDGNAIARYAKGLAQYNRLSEFLEKHGDTYPVYHTDRHGNRGALKMVKRFPQSTARVELEVVLIRLEREFGLTPAARASLQVEQGFSSSIEQKYLGG